MSLGKLYIATGNAHKVEELSTMFKAAALDLSVCSAKEVGGMPDVVEDADTFEGNALLKAKALVERVAPDDWVLADDSGIVVDALGGAPGIYSARYAGEPADDDRNNEKLLNELGDLPFEKRTGRFVCALVLLGNGVEEYFVGKVEGNIGFELKGEFGFGYDPMFVPKGYEITMGQIEPEEKNGISHRGNALSLLVDWFKSRSQKTD